MFYRASTTKTSNIRSLDRTERLSVDVSLPPYLLLIDQYSHRDKPHEYLVT